jgi:hypothetical protein|tara:strand:- start:353 stop:646 length:294 start_codon:yes stop_codon:yes gene_type:complete
MKELSEETNFQVSVKTLIMLGVGLSTLIGMWFALQADIEEAKKLPEPPVSRTEYDLKDQLIRETIMNTQEKVNENGDKLDIIEDRLYEINTNTKKKR